MGHHGLKNTPVNLMFYEIKTNGGKLWPFVLETASTKGTFLMYTVDNTSNMNLAGLHPTDFQ